MSSLIPSHIRYHIAGNFREFRGFVAIREGFLRKIWERGVLWRGMSEQSTEVFCLESFLLYGMQSDERGLHETD